VEVLENCLRHLVVGEVPWPLHRLQMVDCAAAELPTRCHIENRRHRTTMRAARPDAHSWMKCPWHFCNWKRGAWFLPQRRSEGKPSSVGNLDGCIAECGDLAGEAIASPRQ
jgi:hypothetical protein